MPRNALIAPGTITLVLILQIIPLLLFPPASFALTSQEWWLPALLAILALIADAQIILQRSPSLNPWYLLSFIQGFNIISRLMMVWSHATVSVANVSVANWLYIVLTILSIALSAFVLWYTELAEVRTSLLR